jgi:general secretion pathway protein G
MNRRSISGSGGGRSRGFTLVEMMVVISIILILLGVAMPIYSHSITRAKEQNLRNNLHTLNHLIFQYTLDKQKPLQSLDDLKTASYLDKIPDDITGSDTWVTDAGDGVILSLEQTETGGIISVHSGSSGTASDGTAYSSW